MTGLLLALVAALSLDAPRPPQLAADPRCQTPAALTSPDLFVACARAATEKYRDRSAAILDGYRRIGADFPAMGEHWMRVGLVFDQKFDPSRPEVLNYVVKDGTPHLVGVAYAMGLLAGEEPPIGPAGRNAWHDHTRTVGEETRRPHHHHGGSAANGPRIAMLHAWIWSPSPDGMFAADNWAIPFVRLGLRPPGDLPVSAAKALSLVTGGRGYFETAITDAAGAGEIPEVTLALDKAEAAAAMVARDLKDDVPAARVAALAAIWTDMWQVIDAALSTEARQRVQQLPIR